MKLYTFTYTVENKHDYSDDLELHVLANNDIQALEQFKRKVNGNYFIWNVDSGLIGFDPDKKRWDHEQ